MVAYLVEHIVGVGLLDCLTMSTIDPVTGRELPAYDTINTEHESDEKDAKQQFKHDTIISSGMRILDIRQATNNL